MSGDDLAQRFSARQVLRANTRAFWGAPFVGLRASPEPRVLVALLGLLSLARGKLFLATQERQLTRCRRLPAECRPLAAR